MAQSAPLKKSKYFYLDGNLHKALKVIRARDIIIAWHYKDHKRKMYSWSDVQRRMQRAFTLSEVARMIRRHKSRIHEYLYNGDIRRPEMTYSLSTGNPGVFYFSEDDVLELHAHFSHLHRGRPRNDGVVVPQDMPSREEIKLMMKYGDLYFEEDKNKKVPIWRANPWDIWEN